MNKTVTFSKNPAFEWENQARQYPEQGNGIEYFQGYYGKGLWVDCLLYYGSDRQLLGILNHYPFEMFPYQKKGSINIQVRSDKRRRGIATALLNEAIKRFRVNLKKQEYTPTGRNFIKSFMRTSTEYRAFKSFLKY
jgi:GNAT superfamily N-acetyltransferase